VKGIPPRDRPPAPAPPILLEERETVDGNEVYAIVGQDRHPGPEAREAPALNGQHPLA
jgi:hypothetical protein